MQDFKDLPYYQMIEYGTHNSDVAGSILTLSIASNIVCSQANLVSYP